MKLHGGTLFYALAISVIVGLMMSAALAAEFYHRTLLRNDLIVEEVTRNAESGIIYSCTNEIVDSVDVDLFKRGKDSVWLQQKIWGAYAVVISRSHTGTHSCTRLAMKGCIPDAQQNFALWLADMDRPLSVTGSTFLNGTCYLPRAGVERAYIEGKSFSGRNLVNGSSRLSSRFMPDCDKQSVAELQRIIKGKWLESDSVISWNENEGMDIDRSFLSSAIVLTSTGRIDLRNCRLTGQIMISSAVSIVVDETADLDNVILLAPRIFISDHVQGSFQAFATDSIRVEEKVHLEYPSVLAIVPYDKSVERPSIVIGEESEIAGNIFLLCDNTDIRKEGMVALNKNAVLDGELTCYGTIDLKGQVKGSVMCSKFTLRTNSALYDNFLMDAVIDCSVRNEDWLGCRLSHDQQSERIIQWLN